LADGRCFHNAICGSVSGQYYIINVSLIQTSRWDLHARDWDRDVKIFLPRPRHPGWNWDEIESFNNMLQTRPRQDVGMSWDHLETKTSRPRL